MRSAKRKKPRDLTEPLTPNQKGDLLEQAHAPIPGTKSGGHRFDSEREEVERKVLAELLTYKPAKENANGPNLLYSLCPFSPGAKPAARAPPETEVSGRKPHPLFVRGN